MSKIRITLIRSYIGRPEKQRRILRGLGLLRRERSVVLPDTPEIRGMAEKVAHLVKVERVEE
ncbi:MAG: 50S ribosomal protein L30 [Syntrophales bacterium]|nr:50S ribosomal protein L30 [Syntrophales bacterium]